MRIIKKYKIYTKTKNISYYPSRISKFKRTKWLFLKKLIAKSLKKRKKRQVPYKNNLIIKTVKGRWDKLKFAYKNKVFNKRLLLTNLNLNKRRIRLLNLKNKKIKLEKLREYFKQLYYLDHLIFVNKLSPSVFASREYLKQKKLLVNNISTKKMTLKKGDFVHIKDNSFSYKVLNTKYTKPKQISTFTEIDYYSQSFVLIKNLAEIGSSDFSLSVGTSVKLQ
jgi:hypothetical protein